MEEVEIEEVEGTAEEVEAKVEDEVRAAVDGKAAIWAESDRISV